MIPNDRMEKDAVKSMLSSNLLRKYCVYYVVLLLITAVLFGALFGGIYTRGYDSFQKSTVQERLDSTVTELDALMESMSTLALKFSLQREFGLNFLSENKYREIELLEFINQYRNYSAITDTFAFLIKDENGRINVFRNDNQKSDYEVFTSKYGIEANEATYDYFFSRMEKGRMLTADDVVFFSYNLSQHSTSSGVLCFVVAKEALYDRLTLFNDFENISFELTYMGQHLLGTHFSDESVVSQNDSSFKMYAVYKDASFAEVLGINAHRIVPLIIILLCTAMVFAWICYRPIYRLTQKYSKPSTMYANELQALDEMLGKLSTKTALLDQRVTSHSEMLRQYLMLLLLNDINTDSVLNDLKNFGIEFRYDFYSVFTIIPMSENKLSVEGKNTIMNSLSDIGSHSGDMYAIELNSETHLMAIICNAVSEELYYEIIRRLNVYLELQPVKMLLGTGQLVHSVNELNVSFLTALSQTNAHMKKLPHNKPLRDASCKETALEDMIESAVSGNCPDALQNLDDYVTGISPADSELSVRYKLVALSGAVQTICNRTGYILTDDQMSMLVQLKSVESLHYCVLKIIPSVCRYVVEHSKVEVKPITQLVMDYIDEHFSDYDISAQKISKDIGVGVNRTYSIIKENTGVTCTNYISQKRINYAKKLLLEAPEMSVSDISAAAGFGGVSYFIQVFKKAEGITPDAYRKDALSAYTTSETTDNE